ncbi:MAG: hypothetical protein R3Y32_04820 [Bacillota bacterium]
MGILSEIFAELLGAGTITNKTSVSKGANTPYGMADPFANKTTAKKSNSSVKNVPISQQKTALEQHSHKRPSNSNNSRTENRQYAGTLGKVYDEGSNEYGNKSVQVSKPIVSASTISVSDMRKAVIMSEILGKPKSKR